RAADTYNQELLAQINHSGRMHMIPSMVNGKYVIRFCVTYEHATEKDIVDAWTEIKTFAEDILRDATMEIASLPPTPEKEKLPVEPSQLLENNQSKRSLLAPNHYVSPLHAVFHVKFMSHKVNI
ncbi:hypothetical protein DOY81_012013, partial [Sarcophaga bullata]